MGFEVIEIAAGAARAEVVPERGAIATRLVVDGRDVLYLDEATLADPEKNVRGGIPILFPFAGRLADDLLRATGTRMKQHGFGRNRAWRVVRRDADELVLGLEADDATRRDYPFELACETTFRALPDGLHIGLAIDNRGATTMPVAPGWHPYFACAPEMKAALACDAFAAGTLDDLREHDLGFPASGAVATGLPGAPTLSMSPSMRHLQVWTLPGRPFVCLEPFWGPADAIDTELRGEVAPGARLEVWMRITLGAPRGS